MLSHNGFRHLTAKHLHQEAADVWCDALNDAAQEFHIDNTERYSIWMANLCHESSCFTRLVENMNYSAKRLAEVWPSRFAINPEAQGPLRMPNKAAEIIGGRPELIANHVYAGRYGNGAPNTGDGWRYRGRYPCQLTFRSAYEACNAEIGIPEIEAPDLLLNDIPGMARVCAWFWQWKRLSSLADCGDYTGVCVKWNGGQIGMADRMEWHRDVLGAIASYG